MDIKKLLQNSTLVSCTCGGECELKKKWFKYYIQCKNCGIRHVISYSAAVKVTWGVISKKFPDYSFAVQCDRCGNKININ